MNIIPVQDGFKCVYHFSPNISGISFGKRAN